MRKSESLADQATQIWVRMTGRRITLADHPWLQGPIGARSTVGEEWLHREAHRLNARVQDGGGLIPDLESLSGTGFDPAGLAEPVADFYTSTSGWRLDLWSQWSSIAWPFGWLLSVVFARRLRQLSLPLRPLEVAKGMDSTVFSVLDPEGHQVASAWVRRLRATGQTVYSGWYGITTLPCSTRPTIRVVFPLPNGSISVFLNPTVRADGGLRLTSPLGSFGEDGAYLLVAAPDSRYAWVRRAPLAERFDVYVDEEGILRADHAVDLWALPVIRLHYRLERRKAQ